MTIIGAPTWIAYYSDWSNFAIFAHEIEALRYAVEHRMDGVQQVEYGAEKAGVK